MAQEDTPTTTDPTTANRTAAKADDPVGLIEDTIVRRLVRVAVHVRGYAPYYAATVAFGVMLLVVPVIGGGGGDEAVASGVAESTSAPSTTSTAPSGSSSRSAAPVELAGSADDFFTPSVTTEATRSSTPSYDFDDFDYDTGADSSSPAASEEESDKPCYVEPPDGAPISPVSPEREAGNAQNTLENATGQEAPAESGETVGTAVEESGACDDGSSTESLPDPTDEPAAPASTPVDDEVIVDLAGNMFLI